MPRGRPRQVATALGIMAVCAELCVSANLLTWAGVPYVSDGGALPLKLHPGTDLLLTAGAAALASGQAGWVGRLGPALWTCFAGFGACVLSIALLSGPGNLIVLLDTFLPAGLLAGVLSQARPGALLTLRRAMQVLLAANAALALVEKAAQSTLVPLYLNDAAYHPLTEDFRPTALFDHPLTGALMMMIGLALAPSRLPWRLAYQGLLWAALVAFGGRMALGMSVLTVAAGAGLQAGRRVLARDPRAAWTLLMGGAGVLAGAAGLGAAFAAGLGDRLAGHLYWDGSAQVRLAQWQILGRLDAWQLLFGTPREDLLRALNALRLGSGVEVIENFWLLMFVSLGVLGFPLFLAGFGGLLTWCWRRTGPQGRALMLGALVVASASNSLGRKSTVLVCLVAGTLCVEKVEASPARSHAGLDAGGSPLGMPA